jgi:hypothetical protein
LRLAWLFWLLAAVTIAATWWDSGNQQTANTQLPAVLVAAGCGLGLTGVGALLYAVHRLQVRQQRLHRLLTSVREPRP